VIAALRPAWLPAAIIATAAIAVWLGRPLPDSLSGLRGAGPYALLGIAIILAWWFNRGRAFVLAVSLTGAAVALDLAHTRPVYTLIAVLVPLNAFLVLARPERGARYRASYGWFLLLAVEGVLIFLITRTSNLPLEHWALRAPPVPLVARIAFGAAFAAAMWRAWPDYKPLAVGNAGALVAFFLACIWEASPGAYAVFMTAAGAILLGALLQESHQLAFADSLTGLPGRRALEERLRSLGGRYALAMVDVDHFKRFNDLHGHHIGDQVLRLVGRRLDEAAGGGIAYRYGGEEFSVLFAGASLEDAERQLESVRQSIEQYRMAVRGPDRPKRTEEGAKRRGAGGTEQILSVTVSIGVAEPSEARATPQQVLRAADEALYRAKQGGRNRVSR
jgi:diguanylate cyclase (GGDEF)-like protein